jgi:PhnB protein
MFSPEGAHGSQAKAAVSTNNTQGIVYIYVPDVDKHYQQCLQAGGKITMPIDNMFWGDPMYQTQCLNGYLWRFATKSS